MKTFRKFHFFRLVSALGLIENSTGILVASMLISPLMVSKLQSKFLFFVQYKNISDLLLFCSTGPNNGWNFWHNG